MNDARLAALEYDPFSASTEEVWRIVSSSEQGLSHFINFETT